jgi:hypothetical protein
MPTYCERCDAQNTTLTGSWFNTSMICLDCRAREEKHPHINIAKMIERKHTINGNMNFAGIGLSPDNFLIELKGGDDKWFHGLAATADYLHDIGATIELNSLRIGQTHLMTIDGIEARVTRAW